MAKITGIVESVDSRAVNTKFGLKNSFSVTVGGERYAAGFRAPGVAVGDAVVLEYNDASRYKDIISVSKSSGGSIAGASASAAAGAATRSVAPAKSGERPFPVPPLHGDRAIIRQNALSHAARIVAADLSGISGRTTDEIAEAVIRMARKFEAYSTGDIDVAEAEANVKRAAVADAELPDF